MSEKDSIVVGIFEDRTAVKQALANLKKADFQDDQLGFALREENLHIDEEKLPGPGSIVKGIVGGIMGIADVMLVPFTGPADASTILASTLPVAEEALDHLPYPGSHSSTTDTITRPDDALRAETARPAAEPTPEPAPAPARSHHFWHHEHGHTPGEEAERGLVTGGIVGGILGAAAALLIPGIGPALAGGIIATTLGGAAMGGIAGGFLGTFTHLGIPEKHAHDYEQAIKEGHTVVTVQTETRSEEAAVILRRAGAHRVDIHP